MKRLPLLTLSLGFAASAFSAVPVSIVYTDGANEGFNDPTLGASRKAAFTNAVNIWANQLTGSVTIIVEAAFDNLGGDAFQATLGAANPVGAYASFPGAQANTLYTSANANHLAGSDLDPANSDIQCVFNSDVDNSTVLGNVNFYYGNDGNSGSHVDFRSVVLHEMGHGLGFVGLINGTTGAFAANIPDIYSRQLTESTSSNPSDPRTDLDAMTDSQRLSAITGGKLRWKGTNVLGARSNTMVLMYAPNPYADGQSVSHWDTSNSPDLLMEPFDTGPKSDVDLTKQAFQDLGWNFSSSSNVEIWDQY